MFKTKLIRECLTLTVAEQGVQQLPLDKIGMIIDYADLSYDHYDKAGIDFTMVSDDESQHLVDASACSLSNIILKLKENEKGE